MYVMLEIIRLDLLTNVLYNTTINKTCCSDLINIVSNKNIYVLIKIIIFYVSLLNIFNKAILFSCMYDHDIKI